MTALAGRVAAGTAGHSAAGAGALAGRGAADNAGSAANSGAAGGGTAGSTSQSAGGSAAGSGGSLASGASGTGGTSVGSAGTSVGSAGTAASGPCEFPEPPANMADWVDESWGDQLGNNIRTREAWLLDHVMLDKGELHVCVRWGASSPVPDAVRTNLATTTERWFNDWFKGLAGYGCFPYGDGIKVSITGWAVKPGSESLLGTLDPAVPVYTELDGEGDPKCPDACSSFVHWDHDFADCEGGDKNHSDYWLWFNDRLPGGGGAAAVGGDWGLRMPVSAFVDAFEQPSFNTVEHEMGHGFGMQDYYDWRGARPEGGSIMIVGSSPSESPTEADIWLLKRTWKETRELRGW
ncbi:MAG: hypothetical protein ABW321_03780 [Polyangiales bacterium]